MEHETQTSPIEALQSRLDGIPVYVDGELSKRHEAARYGRLVIKTIGHHVLETGKLLVDAIDDMVEAAR